MDELLNQGVGTHMPFPNYPLNDNDNDDDGEKAVSGCLENLIAFIVSLLIVEGVCFVISSCASHKAVTTVQKGSGDSVMAAVMDSIKKIEVETWKQQSFSADTTTTQTSVWESFSGDELVTEHIVEFTDMTGNKTVTTDRTIQRKNQGEKLTDSTEKKGVSDKQTNESAKLADSTAVKYTNVSVSHWEKNDSTRQESKKSKGSSDSWWQRFLGYLGDVAILCAVYLILVCIYRYYFGK